MVGIKETITEYDHSALVANYQSDQDHYGIAKQWFLSNGDILALLPLPDKKLSLVWSTQKDNAHYLSGINEDKRIKEILGKVGYGIGRLKEMTKPHVFPLRLIRVKPIFLDRFILCGDAAHGVHPMAGQGLNLGLADVSTFLELLSNKRTTVDIGEFSLLSSYSRRRVESIALMQGLTHSLYVGFHINTPWVSWVRNTGMTIINGLPGLKKRLLKQAGHA
jgi:2-octaprenyl-6-methoxyphenol hydroxylase